jgi:hypothetical protein
MMRGRLTLSVICAVVVLSGCGGGSDKTSQTPQQVASGFVDAWNRRDAAAVCGYYTEAARELFAQAATTLLKPGPHTCARVVGVTQMSGNPRARWRLRDVLVHDDRASATVAPANRHTPFVTLGFGLVRTGDGWGVGGGTLNADQIQARR